MHLLLAIAEAVLYKKTSQSTGEAHIPEPVRRCKLANVTLYSYFSILPKMYCDARMSHNVLYTLYSITEILVCADFEGRAVQRYAALLVRGF